MKTQPSMIEITIFIENHDRWIWRENHGSGHESADILMNFLRCAQCFIITWLVERLAWRVIRCWGQIGDPWWLGARQMNFSHTIGCVHQLFLFSSREHMHKDCFSEAMSFWTELGPKLLWTNQSSETTFLWKKFGVHAGLVFHSFNDYLDRS